MAEDANEAAVPNLVGTWTDPFKAMREKEVADGSLVDYPPGGYESPEAFLREAHKLFKIDRRVGQPVVVEIVTEAKVGILQQYVPDADDGGEVLGEHGRCGQCRGQCGERG